MATVRTVVGDTLRAARLRQRRTLREVSSQARVSLGYLSEIERGQKEASSELLAAICDALELRLSDVFAQVSDQLRRDEKRAERVRLAHHSAVTGPAGAHPVQPRTPGSAAGSGGPTATVRSTLSAVR